MRPVTTRREGGLIIAEMQGEPDVMLDAALVRELIGALEEAEQTGAGAMLLRSTALSFCAGASFSRLEAWSGSQTGLEIEADGAAWNALFAMLEASSVPVVAQIEGAVLGAGLGLVLACDMRVASASAVFGVPEARFGILPVGGTVERLVRRCGPSAARRLLLTAEIVKGETALALGLADYVVASEAVGETALAVAHKMTRLSAPALAAAKRLVVAAAAGSDTRQIERDELVALATSEPTRQALKSILPTDPHGQKQKPGRNS